MHKKILLFIYCFIFATSAYAELANNTERPAAYDEEKTYASSRADDELINNALQTSSPYNQKVPHTQGQENKSVVNKKGYSAIPNMQSTSIKMIASLFIILSLLFLAAYILKKFMGGEGVFAKNTLIKVIASSYISAKNYIALIDVAGEVIVVGVSNSNISMLIKITDKDTLKRIAGDGTKPASNKRLWQGFFKKKEIDIAVPKGEDKANKKKDDFNHYMNEAEEKEVSIEKLTKTIKDMSNRL